MSRAHPLLCTVLLALAGCGDENWTPTRFTASNDRVSTSTNDSTLVPRQAVPGTRDTLPSKPAATGVATLALASLGGSSLRGDARLAGAGGGSSVAVRLASGVRGISYEGAIRLGSCDRLGPGVASLIPVTADSLGVGRSSSDVPVPIDSLLAGPHAVVFGKGGRPQACGELAPGTRAAAPPPPDTANPGG